MGKKHLVAAVLFSLVATTLAIVSLIGDSVPWTSTSEDITYSHHVYSMSLKWWLLGYKLCLTDSTSGASACKSGDISDPNNSVMHGDCDSAGKGIMAAMVIGATSAVFTNIVVILACCNIIRFFRFSIGFLFISIGLYVVSVWIWSTKCNNSINDTFGHSSLSWGFGLTIGAIVLSTIAFALQLMECVCLRFEDDSISSSLSYQLNSSSNPATTNPPPYNAGFVFNPPGSNSPSAYYHQINSDDNRRPVQSSRSAYPRV